MSQPRCSPCGCDHRYRSYFVAGKVSRCIVHDVEWTCGSAQITDGVCEACGRVQEPLKPRRVRVVRIEH